MMPKFQPKEEKGSAGEEEIVTITIYRGVFFLLCMRFMSFKEKECAIYQLMRNRTYGNINKGNKKVD